MRDRRRTLPLPRPRWVAALAAATALLLVATGCSHENDDRDRARDRTNPSATPSGSGPASGSPSGSAGGRGYPELEAEDYVYRLEVLCFCPMVGAVRVTVEDGEVASATSLQPGRGVKAGDEAPDYARLTINDIIAKANDTSADKVDVTWPEGQDWPSVVEVDQLERAVDDEVTYTIKNVNLR